MRALWPLVCAAASMAPSVSLGLPENNAATSSPPAYEIREIIAPSGAKFYGVKCRAEAPRCKYDWNSLCTESTPRYVKADGTPASAPTFVRDSDGQFMALFMCEPNKPFQPIARENARSG
jgi:hypothetical protein